MPVEKFKANFAEALEEVKQGKKIGVLYGKSKKPVAMLVPFAEEEKGERQIGILDGKAVISFRDDFEMTPMELCGL